MASTVISNKKCSFHAKKEAPKGKKSCEEANCELVGFNSLPDFLKDNEFILGYYRSEWPLKQTILSIFSVHNETLNVWTHLVGFLLFLALTVCALNMIPSWNAEIGTTHHQLQHTMKLLEVNPNINPGEGYKLITLANHTVHAAAAPAPEGSTLTRWPFLVYLAGAMVCLLSSSACHLLSCHSEKSCHAMLHLDYTGIVTLMVASYYPLIYYTFMCEPYFQALYLGSITLFGAAMVVVTLVPVFRAREFRVFRTLLFGCLGVSGMVPFVHKLIMFGDRPEAVDSAGYEMLMFAFYGIGGVVYMMRVPERWMPGMFDLVGHSHQIFHVLIVAAAYSNYVAITIYLQWRDTDRGC